MENKFYSLINYFIYNCNSSSYDEEIRLAITMCLHYAAKNAKGKDRKINHFQASLKYV